MDDVAKVADRCPAELRPATGLCVCVNSNIDTAFSQFLSIDGGLGYVLKAQEEELQRLPMIDRKQIPQRIH